MLIWGTLTKKAAVDLCSVGPGSCGQNPNHQPREQVNFLLVLLCLHIVSTSDHARMGLYSKGYWLNEFPQYLDLYHSAEWWTYNLEVSRA